MSGEADEDYKWALNTFKNHVLDGDVKQSNVVITDKCPALKNALSGVMSTVP